MKAEIMKREPVKTYARSAMASAGGSSHARRSCGNENPVPGDIWWVDDMRFDDGVHGKGRPVLVVGARGDIVLFRRCTSQPSSCRNRLMVQDEISAGLGKSTFIDMEVQSINRNRLKRKLGHLSDCDMDLATP